LLVGNNQFEFGGINRTNIPPYASYHGRAVNGAAESSFERGNRALDVWKRAKTEYANPMRGFHVSRPTDAFNAVDFKCPIFIFEGELSGVWINRI
jgi:hypothetical protein